jgi:putative toxin-antitoxin system antitoxin component (TIGR02293 family)
MALYPSNEADAMGAVDEPVAARKRRPVVALKRRAKGLFANSPLTVFDSGDPAQIIEFIRKGLPAQAVDFVAGLLSLSRAAFLEAIKIPPSTVERRLRTAEALTLEESDRVSRVAKVLRRAIDVFGDEVQAKAWMIDSVSSLGGRTPLSLLDTMEGYELVINTLSRIEYGVYG